MTPLLSNRHTLHASRGDTAALQAAQAGGGQPAPVLLRVTTRAGHGAGKPVGVLLEERADVLTFLCRTVGAGRLDRVEPDG